MIEPTLEFIGNGLRAGSNPASFYFSYGNALFIFDYHPAHERFFCTREMIQTMQRSCTIIFVDTMRSRTESMDDKKRDHMKVDVVKRAIGTGMPMPKIVFFFPEEERGQFHIRTIQYNTEEPFVTIKDDTLMKAATVMTNKDPIMLFICSNVIERVYELYEKYNFGEVVVWIKTSHTHPFFIYNGLQGLFPDTASFNNPFVKNIVYLDNFMMEMTLDRDAYLKNLGNTISQLKGPVYLLGRVPELYKVNIVDYKTKRA